MPSRNLVYESLALRARESPGGSRILTLLTAEAGLVDVFVFGGPKSKLRSLASPYASGRAFVYLDPVKDFQKLSDFEVRDSYPALRDELERIWSAGLVAELLVKTSGGGGDYPLVLELARSCLEALDQGGHVEGPILTFIWRLLSLIGLGPDPTACALCGAELRPSSGGAYSFVRESFLCPSCAAREVASGAGTGAAPIPGVDSALGAVNAEDAGTSGGDASRFLGARGRLLRLGPDVFRWLERASYSSFAEASRAEIPADCLDSLKALIFGLARRAAEAPLASFSRGAGLL